MARSEAQRAAVKKMTEISAARRRAQTHCIHGHEYTKDNTYFRKDRPGRRQCIRCMRIATNRWEKASRVIHFTYDELKNNIMYKINDMEFDGELAKLIKEQKRDDQTNRIGEPLSVSFDMLAVIGVL